MTTQTWENRKTIFGTFLGLELWAQFSGWRSGDSENLPTKFSKDKASNFQKIKTDLDLLYSFPRYTPLKIGTFYHFWGRNSGTKIFPDMRFSAKWAHYYPLTISRKSRKTNYSILSKVQKGPILGQFGPIFQNLGKMRIFSKNRALSLFYI